MTTYHRNTSCILLAISIASCNAAAEPGTPTGGRSANNIAAMEDSKPVQESSANNILEVQQSGFQLVAMAAMACTCVEPPALVAEKRRLAAIGGTLSGICGDRSHTSGYHVPACNLARSDYSLRNVKNRPSNLPANRSHAAAIDIGMDWSGSRNWLRWLIQEKRAGRLTGVVEVIGSYNGKYVMYWSDTDTPGWPTNGIDYYKKKGGRGHDTWTHVAIYRSTTNRDHRILEGSSGRCTAADQDRCLRHDASCERAFDVNGNRRDLCRWHTNASQASCSSTAGIWTAASSGFAQRWPTAVPAGAAGACITQVNNLK